MTGLTDLFTEIRADLIDKYNINLQGNAPLVFLFNPSHEMALAENSDNYTPTAVVRKMQTDLALLPAVFCEDQDLIAAYGEKAVFNKDGHKMDVGLENAIPFPWGWNRAARSFFLKLGVSPNHMPDDKSLELVRYFACRKFHALFIQMFLNQAKISGRDDLFVGDKMEFCENLSCLRDEQMPMIFKLPWSSSGRGIFVADKINDNAMGKLRGFIKSQGGFLKDCYYEKVLDFAMEFYVFSNGKVSFVGFSLFQADTKGKYGGNLVDSQVAIEQLIASHLKSELIIPFVKNECRNLLERTMGGKYTGFVGVDMMVVDTPNGRRCHPCVEINPRMNMGILAMAAYLRPFFFCEGGGGGNVVGERRRSSTRTPSEVIRERGFHTCFNDRFISIKYS